MIPHVPEQQNKQNSSVWRLYPKPLPFTTSLSSFYSGTGTILPEMHFACDLELVLDLYLPDQSTECHAYGYAYMEIAVSEPATGTWRRRDNLCGEAETSDPCYIIWSAAVILKSLWWPPAPPLQDKAIRQCLALPLCVLDTALLCHKMSWQNSVLSSLLRGLIMALFQCNSEFVYKSTGELGGALS